VSPVHGSHSDVVAKLARRQLTLQKPNGTNHSPARRRTEGGIISEPRGDIISECLGDFIGIRTK